jgi:hypothetical protein
MNAIFVALTVCAGLFFYWLRGQFRFIYGLCEIVVALVVIYLTFYPHTYNLVTRMPTFSEMILSKSIGVLGGIYIMVRGLDNMEKALPAGWRNIWELIFCKRPTHSEGLRNPLVGLE